MQATKAHGVNLGFGDSRQAARVQYNASATTQMYYVVKSHNLTEKSIGIHSGERPKRGHVGDCLGDPRDLDADFAVTPEAAAAPPHGRGVPLLPCRGRRGVGLLHDLTVAAVGGLHHARHVEVHKLTVVAAEAVGQVPAAVPVLTAQPAAVAGGPAEVQHTAVVLHDALREHGARRVEVEVVLEVVVEEAEHLVAAHVAPRNGAWLGPRTEVTAVEEGERTALEHRVLEGRPR